MEVSSGPASVLPTPSPLWISQLPSHEYLLYHFDGPRHINGSCACTRQPGRVTGLRYQRAGRHWQLAAVSRRRTWHGGTVTTSDEASVYANRRGCERNSFETRYTIQNTQSTPRPPPCLLHFRKISAMATTNLRVENVEAESSRVGRHPRLAQTPPLLWEYAHVW